MQQARTDMNHLDQGTVGSAAFLLKTVSKAFAEALRRGGTLRGVSFVDSTLTILGAHGYLQCEAIVALAGSNERFGLQLAQLLRPLIDTWSVSSWIVEPPDDGEQLQRALGYEKYSLGQHRSKWSYQTENGLGQVDKAARSDLAEHEQRLDRKIEEAGCQAIPTARDLMEGLGRQDRYLIWRWASAAVHAESSALRQFNMRDSEGILNVGVPLDTKMVLNQIVTAWEVADDLFRATLTALSLDDDQFLHIADNTEREFRLLMERVSPGSTIPET